MFDDEINDLKEISETITRINGKLKLLKLLEKAKEEYDKNNFVECKEACIEILKKDSANFVALRGLGCVAQIKGNYDDAIKYYNKALENSKTKEIEYTLIGTVYYLQDKFDEAIKYYNLAIDENENYDSAYEGKNQSMLENHLTILDLQDNLIKRNIF